MIVRVSFFKAIQIKGLMIEGKSVARLVLHIVIVFILCIFLHIFSKDHFGMNSFEKSFSPSIFLLFP